MSDTSAPSSVGANRLESLCPFFQHPVRPNPPCHSTFQVYVPDIACYDDAVGNLFPSLLFFSCGGPIDFFIGLPDRHNIWGISSRYHAGRCSCYTYCSAMGPLFIGKQLAPIFAFPSPSHFSHSDCLRKFHVEFQTYTTYQPHPDIIIHSPLS
jgi:hypothetical protein